jgi:hypothetical protein
VNARDLLDERLLRVDPDENPLVTGARAAVLAGLAAWGLWFVRAPLSWEVVNASFMHNVNLPFHEAGHLLFSPFGRFLSVLGGSLMQLIVPLTVTVAFVLKGNPFGASAGLWWAGQSLVDLAPYIDDARAGEMPLLGGVTGAEVADYHDWEVILSSLGWMTRDHAIAAGVRNAGRLLIVIALLWGGTVLVRTWRARKTR